VTIFRRLLVLAAVATACLLLAGCGSTVSARCATTIKPDGSGSRTLSFLFSKSDVAGQGVDINSIKEKLKAAKPDFAEFRDESTSQTYKFLITYSFSGPDEFRDDAQWFSSTASIDRSGGIFSPSLELTEKFTAESWFQWALKATGRSSSDIKDVSYSLEMPWQPQSRNSDTQGSTDGNTWTLSDLSFSTEQDIDVQSETSYGLSGLEIKTNVGGDGRAHRDVTYAVDPADLQELESINGGEPGLTSALASWAGDGWQVKIGQEANGATPIALSKDAPSVSALAIGDSQATAPRIVTTAASNAYVTQREYAEDFSPSALMPGVDSLGHVAYELTLPWTIKAATPSELHTDGRGGLTLTEDSAGGESMHVQLVEVRSGVVFPVLIALAGATTLLVVVALIAVIRLATARAVA
jgi:outer membrane murein-binding lipoprotein Lpp